MLDELSKKIAKIQSAFSSNNARELREIADQAVYRASLENDSLQAEIAVLAYALHKLLTKEHLQGQKGWKIIQKNIRMDLADAQKALVQKNVPAFEKLLDHLQEHVYKIDSREGHFVQNLLEKSRVKQASSLYAFGLSLGQATGLTGANKKDLFNYIGYTKMHDEQKTASQIESRVKRLDKVLV